MSHAGKRLGIRPGTRSGLWSHFAYAIDQLRPRLVVIENVRGLLSAKAHSDVEPCAWCVGDDTEGALRALGAVLGDLAGLGYDARWAGVRAADAGAPHGRFRVFIVAYPRGGSLAGIAAAGERLPVATQRSDAAVGDTAGGRWDAPADARPGSDWRSPLPAGGHGGAATDATGDGRHEGRAQLARLIGRHDAAERGATAADTDSAGGEARVRRPGPGHAGRREPMEHRSTDWGDYAAAIHRWERTLGRVAPPPTEVCAKGQPRLSPRFVEWMMGLPDGHVTGVDISRNDQLKALGNGVVPQQAELALRWLLFGEWAGVGGDVAALPTPTVNDMGAGKNVEAWDEWTSRMKAEHGNGNGHGKSLAIEAQRLGGDAA